MKRTTLKLMAALFVAALSLGFTSCSDDDDSSDKKVVTLEDLGDDEYSDGLLKYSLGEDGTACVLGFVDNASSELTIPAKAKFDGKTYSVTAIGNGAFFDYDNLTSVTFPNTIKEIGEDAFYDCNNLTSAVLPKSIKTIGDKAFDYCYKLENIGSLNTVEKVGRYCFYGTQLERVTIPATLAEIGEGAFSGSPKLQEIVVEAGNPTYDSRGKCNAIIEKETNTLHTACVNTVIPNDVTIIGPSAYRSVPIESIEIPSWITTIGDYAFCDCENLKSIVIPDNVTKLGESAFYYCISLQSVTLSKNIEAIESGTFYECINLKTVNFPEGTKVKSINEGAFAFSGIESINLPTSLTKIGDRAFCYSSLKEITLGTTITSIGEDAFDCGALSKVTCLRNYPVKYNADENAFGDVATINKTLYVNAGFGCKSLYESSSPWKKFKTIKTL